MQAFISAIDEITPEVYEKLKLAVEVGKWEDGNRLTPEQRTTSMQAVIAWEMKNLPEDQRTGYMGEQHCSSKSEPIPNILFSSGQS